MNLSLFKRILCSSLFMGSLAFASPASLTYQGRIVKADGSPLEHNNVSFQFEVLSTSGLCVLYREQVNGLNMVHSNGMFDVKIGASHSYPLSASFSIIDSFNNSVNQTCEGGSIFSPSATEGRILRVQFHDGSSWRLISPDTQIRTVPYAGYATTAAKLGDKTAADFVGRPAVCSAGQVITFDGTNFNCAAGGGGGGSGTVTSVATGAGLTGGTITATGTISLAPIADKNLLANISGAPAAPTATTLSALIDSAISNIQGGVLYRNNTGWVALPPGTSGHYLQTQGAGANPQWSAVAGSSGTVTSVAAGTGLTGGPITTTGSLAVDVGTGAGQIPQLDGSGKLVSNVIPTNIVTTATTLGGDLSGNLPNPAVVGLQGRPVANTAPAHGQVLLWDTNTWKPEFIRMEDIRNAWGGTQMIPATACTANQAMIWSVITDRFTCQNIGSLDTAAVTTGVFNTARLGTGTADNTKYLRGDGTWQTPSTSDATKLPLAGGTMAGTINMNGNQITNISNVPFVATNPAAGQDGQTLRWNNTAGQWEWFTAGAAGAGITTINGLNGSAQTLAPSASASSYGFSSAGSSHTLSIPSASTAGVTAGTISKTEYDAFSAKQDAGNFITTMTGDVTSSGFAAGSVTTTIANNAVTTAKINDGAVTTSKIADGNVTGVKLENSGVTAGTYPKVTVDAKGRVTAGSALSASDIPNLDAAKITTGVLDPARLGTGTADNTRYLRGDGTWQVVPASGGTVTSITAGAGLTGGTITGSGTIGLGTELTGVNSLATTGFVRRTGAGTYATSTSIDLASQITGTLPIANGGTGATTAIGALTNILPAQTGNAGKVLQTDGANVTWETPAASGITALTGDVTASGSGSVAATIAAGAVTTAKIADGNVTGVKLENSGVTAGTYGSASSIPSFTVDAKGRITSVSANSVSGLLPAAAGNSGKFLKSDGTNWAGADVLFSEVKNAAGLAAFSGSACAANQSLGWSSVTDSFVCQAIGSLNASAITAGTIASARLGSGTADNTTYLRGDGTWATVSTADATKLPLAGGTMAGTINMNGNQITNVGNVPFAATNPAAGQDGQTLRWNNTSGQWEWFTAGAAGAGIASVNGLSGSAQTLAPSATATSYGFSSAGSTHTLSIPSASTAGVTAGTISKTEYDAFSAKQDAGNYITTMTGDVTSSGFAAGSVATTIANNAVTTAKIADGNVTGVKLENSGVTAGTYPKVTVDAKGRVTVGASLSASDIPNLDAAKITSGVLDSARLGTGTADNTKYLRGDGTWQVVPASGGTVTSITAGAGLTGGTITGSGTIGLDTELAGVNALATTGFVRRTGAGTYATSSSIDLASQITGTLPIANGGTGATSASAALTNLLPTQTGNNGKVLQTDGTIATWVTPAASGITALTGDVTASGSGSVAATIAAGAVTTTKIADGNVTGVKLENSGVTAGTYPKVTVDAKGRVTTGTTLSASDIPNLDAAKITSGVIAVARLATGTPDGTKFLRDDGTWQAVSAPAEADPQVGANTINYVPKWDGSALVTSGISEVAGDVGIGVASPDAKLHVVGQVKITGGSPGVGKVLTSDAAGLATWTTPAVGNVGTVTSVGAGTGLTGGPITSSGNLAVDVGTGANQIPQLDVSGKLNSSVIPTNILTSSTTLGGDLSGTLPNPTVAKIQSRAVANTAPSDGQVLLWDNGNTTWTPNYVRMQDIRNAWGGTQMIPSTACAANETMVWSVVTDRFTCQSIGSLNASAISAGVLATGRLGTGTADNTKFLRGDGTWQAVSVTETDPEVGSNTLNALSKWNGSALVASGVSDDGSNVAVTGNLRTTGQISSPSQALTVASIDWNAGNTAKTSYDCSGNLSFANLRDGGTYTLVVTSTGTTQCSFSTSTTGSDAGTVSYRFKPANAARTASSYTVYTFLRVGSEVLVSWTSGF